MDNLKNLSGEQLDKLAKTHGISRNIESDESLRVRVLEKVNPPIYVDISMLHKVEVSNKQQLGIWYRGCWCGRFKKGFIPNISQVEEMIVNQGFYCCEVGGNHRAIKIKIIDL